MMKKPKITMNVIKEDIGFSAHANIGLSFIATEGSDLDDLKKNIIEAVNLTFEDNSIIYTLDDITLNPGMN